MQADGRFYTADRTTGMADTFVMRRVRPILEGTIFGNVDFRVMPDFGEGRTVLQDAYADLRFTPAVKLRAGKFKSPFGLERLVSAQDLLFVDRASDRAGAQPRRRRDVVWRCRGLDSLVYGGRLRRRPRWRQRRHRRQPRQRCRRARLPLPFRNNRTSPLQQVGIGLAASVGERQGTATAPGLPSFRTTAADLRAVSR